MRNVLGDLEEARGHLLRGSHPGTVRASGLQCEDPNSANNHVS